MSSSIFFMVVLFYNVLGVGNNSVFFFQFKLNMDFLNTPIWSCLHQGWN